MTSSYFKSITEIKLTNIIVNAPSWSLTLFFILMPLVYSPRGAVPFEVPKIFFFYLFVYVFLLLGFTASIIENRSKRYDKKLLFLLLLFIVVQIVASVFGVNVWKSWTGNLFRSDGLLSELHFFVFVCCVAFFWKNKYNRALVGGIAGGALLVSSWAVFEGVEKLSGLLTSEFWQGGVGVSFGNPIFLGGYLVVALPFVWRFSQSKYFFYLVKYVLIAIPIAAIICTHSLISVAGVFIWIVIEAGLKLLSKKYFLLIIGLLFVISYGVIWGWDIYSPTLIAESRSRILPKLMLAASKRPLLGYGLANVDTAFASVQWPKNLVIESDIHLDKAHSILLEILVTSGIIGVAIYCWIVKAVHTRLTESHFNSSKVLLIGLVLYLWHSQLNVISISEELIFWTIVGIAVQVTSSNFQRN